jgi:predicted ArsR family transcriptional regulator
VDASQHRDAIVDALREADDGLDATELAAAISLHPNTVRWHVAVLADRGLVAAAPRRRPGRGRPRVIYRLTPDGIVRDRDEYRLLATMLTSIVAAEPDGEARAYEEGVRRGRELQAAEPLRAPAEVLDRQGFAVSATEGRIDMRRCPFSALAASTPHVVCTVHRGIIDGALAEAGCSCHVERLEPFVEPTLCVAHLAPNASR